jgi:putative methionine-R-sulfoxide reductase with GAF domain
MARQEIEDIAPLKTDLLIKRGDAPGAGFAPEAGMEGAAGAMQEAREVVFATPAGQCRSLTMGFTAGRQPETDCAFGEMLKSMRAMGEALTSRLMPFIPFEFLVLYLKRGDFIHAGYTTGLSERAFTTQPIPVGEGLSGWVAMHQRPIVNGNPSVEPNLNSTTNLFAANSSAISLPLLNGEGAVFGVLTLYSRQPAAFSKDHLRLLEETMPDWALLLAEVTSLEDPTQRTNFQFSNASEAVLQGARSR